MMGRRSNSIW